MSAKPRPCALLCARERDAEIERLASDLDNLAALTARVLARFDKADPLYSTAVEYMKSKGLLKPLVSR